MSNLKLRHTIFSSFLKFHNPSKFHHKNEYCSNYYDSSAQLLAATAISSDEKPYHFQRSVSDGLLIFIPQPS